MNRVAMLTILMLSVLTPDYVCAQIPAEQDNLSLVSEWDLLGPDGDMSGLPIGLKEDHWVEEIYVDEAALRRNGIRLEQIRIEHVRTSGVSRRSALRFLLSMHGLGFWSPSAGSVVITTEAIADTYWHDSSSRPSSEMFVNGSLDARRNAVFLAAYYTIESDDHVDGLIACLQDPDTDLRFNAAYAIAQFGASGARAARQLGITLHHEDLTVRESCGYALGNIGKSGACELVKILSDSDHNVARMAARSLRYCGSPRGGLIPDVVSAALAHVDGIDLDEEHVSLLSAFADTVVNLDNGQAELIVAPLLQAVQPGPRVFALNVICYLGARSRLDVESYIQMLTDDNVYVRRRAAFALLTVDTHAIKSVSVLMGATVDNDAETRRLAQLVAAKIRSQTPTESK